MNDELKARVIAFYLPQYHPVPVNDRYWGKGFTEWTNVAKAKPLFRHHYEPRIPADLGFYDLRLPEVREEQAELAKEAGVEGFCYWHYWFGNGEEVLERPLDEVIRSHKPDFPICVGWANHSWTTATWTNVKGKQEKKYIFKQEYNGEEDYKRHFLRLLPVFQDPRYIHVEGKLLFLIFDLKSFPDFPLFKQVWTRLAEENGLPGFYFVAHANTVDIESVHDLMQARNLDVFASDAIDHYLNSGVDAVETLNLQYAEIKTKGLLHKALSSEFRKLKHPVLEKYDYGKIVKNYYIARNCESNVFPEILVGNDRSPRAGRRAIIYDRATPEKFYEGAKKAISLVQGKDADHRVIFLNSWNEWGEGAYMEPDQRYGKGFIKALYKALKE